MRKYYTALAMQHPPRLSFAAAKMDFNHWQPLARQKLLELLGPFPEKVPLAAEQEEPVQCEGYTRIRVVFDSEEHMSVPCILLVPECASKKAPVPAILCSHGHGNFGKEPVAGIALTQRHLDDIRDMNYDYARQMAQAGFVTLVPDRSGLYTDTFCAKNERKHCVLVYIAVRGNLSSSAERLAQARGYSFRH